MNNAGPIITIVLYIYIAMIVGYVKCVINFVSCNFEPIGKAELVYGVGTFTGLGVIIGYMDIKDK